MITFDIPGPLRTQTEGRSKVQVGTPARTVMEALAALWQAYPGLRDRVLNEQGATRQHVNIFVGEQNIRDCGGLAAPVSDGCEITIVPNVAGGS
jgi:molybdopterin converting factor small subunit